MKKKRYLLLVLVWGVLLTVFAVPHTVEAASSKTMKKAYVKYLKDKVSGKKYYSIVNIGEKGKPALLIAKGECLGSKNYYVECNVYYYIKGKVKKIGDFSLGGRTISLAKKKGQYYLKNGLSDAAFFAYIKNNKLYKYEFYDEWGTSKVKAGNKTVKKLGCLSASEYAKKRDSYTYVKDIKFVKNTSKNRKKIL